MQIFYLNLILRNHRTEFNGQTLFLLKKGLAPTRYLPSCEKSRQLYFNVSQKSPNLYHPKEQVLGVEIGNTFKAYPFFELNQSKLSIINDEIENQQITIHWDESHQSGKILDKKGAEIPVIQLFWFAWYTFHPETLIYQPD